MLDAFGFIQYGDRVADVFYPDFIDLNPSMIPLALDVVHAFLPK
jgi:endonuclease YncB( thermonuclease family)